jgi:hypothetical protein
MPLWFKIFDDALDDPRLQLLPAATFKTFVNLLCVASKRGGALPAIGELAFMLRQRAGGLAKRLEALVEAGLLEAGADGVLRPAEWDKRQPLRETTTEAEPLTGAERTRRWRERQGVTERDAPVTERDVTVTGDIDQDQDQDSQFAPMARESDRFAEFWGVFPKRQGDNPEAPARAAWRKAVAGGADPTAIVDAAKAYRETCRDREPKFVASAARWLSEERWRSSTPKAEAAAAPPGVWIGLDKPGWPEWAAWWRATKGRSPPTDARGCWRFPSLSPPALEAAA